MKTFSLGEALGSGFGLVARRPLTVLAWGVLLYLPGLASLMGISALPGAAWMDPTVPADAPDAQAINAFLRVQGWSMLSNALSLIVQALVGVAVIRLVLWPRDSGWAGLRLGVAEFCYIVVQIIIWIGIWILMMLTILVVFGTVISLSGPHPAFMPVAVVAALVLFLWVWARTGLISVASVDRRTLAFDEGWRRARGQTLKLAVMGVLSLLLCVIASIPMLALIALSLGLAGLDWDALFRAEFSALTWNARSVIGSGMALLCGVAGAGVLTAILFAPWASAYKQLKPKVAAAHPESS